MRACSNKDGQSSAAKDRHGWQMRSAYAPKKESKVSMLTGILSATFFRSMPLIKFIFLLWIFRMSNLEPSLGLGNSIFRSILPGRNSAASKMSILLVAIKTCKIMQCHQCKSKRGSPATVLFITTMCNLDTLQPQKDHRTCNEPMGCGVCIMDH